MHGCDLFALNNIRKVTVFLLMQSFTEVLIILGALLLRIDLPLTALMILWMNLVEDGLPNIALSFEPGEKDVMKRAPLKKNEPILNKELKIITFVVGILADVILTSIFIYLDTSTNLSLDYLRTFVFASIGLDSFFYIYAIKSLRQPIWKTSFFMFTISSDKFSTGTILFRSKSSIP